ncbi:MAG: DUF362 domain-containing protein [Clostridia bacterium]|nr:DUF362 domain-containing protein [Clostridia bacterium]
MPVPILFMDMRSNRKQNLFDKLGKLYGRTGFGKGLEKDDLVALKLHFGETGNITYIRPQFIRLLVDLVRKDGGKPFLTDANTLYVGSRANAVDHLEAAVKHGFDFAVVNAPLVIADGLKGKDYREIEVNLKHFKTVKIGSAVCDADALLCVTHFKGHEATGFGGALKNIGMGLGSRSGKQMMHSDILPTVDAQKCRGCGHCLEWCPTGAVKLSNVAGDSVVARIDEGECIGCGECTVTCSYGSIAINWKTEPDIIQEKIVEYAWGVLKDKIGKSVFISFVNNVTPDCDCCGWSDSPIVRDIGVLASVDPVALDQACVDLVNAERGLAASRLGAKTDTPDKFRTLYPQIDWRRQLEYGEQIGLGTRNYTLVHIT